MTSHHTGYPFFVHHLFPEPFLGMLVGRARSQSLFLGWTACILYSRARPRSACLVPALSILLSLPTCLLPPLFLPFVTFCRSAIDSVLVILYSWAVDRCIMLSLPLLFTPPTLDSFLQYTVYHSPHLIERLHRIRAVDIGLPQACWHDEHNSVQHAFLTDVCLCPTVS
jgi:hypothetical protein